MSIKVTRAFIARLVTPIVVLVRVASQQLRVKMELWKREYSQSLTSWTSHKTKSVKRFSPSIRSWMAWSQGRATQRSKMPSLVRLTWQGSPVRTCHRSCTSRSRKESTKWRTPSSNAFSSSLTYLQRSSTTTSRPRMSSLRWSTPQFLTRWETHSIQLSTSAMSRRRTAVTLPSWSAVSTLR